MERFNINYSDKISIEENSSFSETDSGSDNGSGVHYSGFDFDDESDNGDDLNFQDLSEISSMESDEKPKYNRKQTSQNNKKTTLKRRRKNKPSHPVKKPKKEKKYSKKRKSKIINLEDSPSMCPYCYEPKDVKGHPLECTKLQSIIKTELQKHKFSYIIAKLNVETCLEGKEVIDLFIDNSKCKATTVLKKYFDILSNNTGKKSKVGYEGRLVKNKHLKILIQNQQKRKKTLFENIDPQNPESQFFSKEKTQKKTEEYFENFNFKDSRPLPTKVKIVKWCVSHD